MMDFVTRPLLYNVSGPEKYERMLDKLCMKRFPAYKIFLTNDPTWNP